MRSPFRSKYKITQVFGNNPEYYGQFKLKGHEGIDLIPTGTVWDVLSLDDGVVVLDDDFVGSVSSDPYGKIVTIWHTKLNKATMYCHLSENTVSQGQVVSRGEKIGTMGSTGNSTGAHLHLNLFATDSNGIRQNRDNGFLGGIDPLPFLEEQDALPQNSDQSLIDQLRAERDTNWNLYMNEQKAKIDLEDAVQKKQTTIDNLTKENLDLKTRVESLTKEKEILSTSLQEARNKLDSTTVELSVCNGLMNNRKTLDQYQTRELITEIINRIVRR